MNKHQQVADNYKRLVSFAWTGLRVHPQDKYDLVHTTIVQCLEADNPESCSLNYMFRAMANTLSKLRNRENNYARKLRRLASRADCLRDD
jgi:hypothetical protein